jgi:hypothetical protein
MLYHHKMIMFYCRASTSVDKFNYNGLEASINLDRQKLQNDGISLLEILLGFFLEQTKWMRWSKLNYPFISQKFEVKD